jgi:hypothetical protein
MSFTQPKILQATGNRKLVTKSTIYVSQNIKHWRKKIWPKIKYMQLKIYIMYFSYMLNIFGVF